MGLLGKLLGLVPLRALLRRFPVSKVLPWALRQVAEGKLDEALGLTAASGLRRYPLKRLYWAVEGLKTWTGMVLLGVGTGLEAVAGSFPPEAYPDFAWAAPAARACFAAGALLCGLGLADGGTRSPWPAGTVIPPEAKR